MKIVCKVLAYKGSYMGILEVVNERILSVFYTQIAKAKG